MAEALTQVGGESGQEALALRAAVETWAESSTAKDSYKRRELIHTKRQAVASFFTFVGHHLPEEVTTEDCCRWLAEMESKELSAATIYSRLSRLAAFYSWLMSDPLIGRHLRLNPARVVLPKRPRSYQNESAKAYTDDEMRRLLAVIREEADAGKVTAKRDLALTLIYLLSGIRRSENISLRGMDVEVSTDRMVITYRRKGGYYLGREVNDPSACEALLNYLRASDRIAVIGTPRPLWTRHDRAGRAGAPLTSHAYDKNLKAYAQRAGVKDARIHRARHTFARLVAESSGSIREVQDALDHADLSTTRVYVQRISVKADKHSRNIAERLKS